MHTPLGILVLIGGSEDRGPEINRPPIAEYHPDYHEQEILRFLIAQTGVPHPRIAVIVSASNLPREMAEMYQSAFAYLGQPPQHLDFLDLRDRAAANSDEVIHRLRSAHLLMFSGGDQLRLATQIAGTRFHEVLLERYWHEPVVIAGTSAGSMAFPATILYEGSRAEAMLRGQVKMSSGLSLIDGCLVDTHFIKRGRFARLAQAVVTNPACVGIGLGEDTALVIRYNTLAECLGSGMVVIIDGHDIGASNVADVPDGAPLFVENLRVHCMIRGNTYHLRERQFYSSSQEPEARSQ